MSNMWNLNILSKYALKLDYTKIAVWSWNIGVIQLKCRKRKMDSLNCRPCLLLGYFPTMTNGLLWLQFLHLGKNPNTVITSVFLLAPLCEQNLAEMYETPRLCGKKVPNFVTDLQKHWKYTNRAAEKSPLSSPFKLWPLLLTFCF